MSGKYTAPWPMMSRAPRASHLLTSTTPSGFSEIWVLHFSITYPTLYENSGGNHVVQNATYLDCSLLEERDERPQLLSAERRIHDLPVALMHGSCHRDESEH